MINQHYIKSHIVIIHHKNPYQNIGDFQKT